MTTHLNTKWKVNPEDEQQVITDDPSTRDYWNVCDVCNDLPDDPEGLLVAQRIVDDHNTMLEAHMKLATIAHELQKILPS